MPDPVDPHDALLARRAAVCGAVFHRKPAPVACGWVGADGDLHVGTTNAAWQAVAPVAGTALHDATPGVAEPAQWDALRAASADGAPHRMEFAGATTASRWRLETFCPRESSPSAP